MRLLSASPTIFRLTGLMEAARQIIPPLIQQPKAVDTDITGLELRRASYREYAQTILPWQSEILTMGSEPAVFARTPEGLYGAHYQGKLIGSIGSFALKAQTWIGYVYVEEIHRNKGYASAMLKAVAQEDRAKGYVGANLVCVEGGLTDMYRKQGYVQRPDDNIIFKSNADELASFNVTADHPVQPRSTSAAILRQIVAYDAAVHRGVRRPAFCLNWLAKPRTELFVAATEDQNIVGIGVVNAARYPVAESAYRIAPIYADCPEVAYSILSAALSLLDDNRPVFVDGFGQNPSSVELINTIGVFSEYLRLSNMVTNERSVDVVEASQVFSPWDYGTGP